MTTSVFIDHFYEYLYPFSLVNIYIYPFSLINIYIHSHITLYVIFLMNLKSIFTYIPVLKKNQNILSASKGL